MAVENGACPEGSSTAVFVLSFELYRASRPSFAGTRLVEDFGRLVGLGSVMLCLILRPRDVAQRFHQALRVLPGDPFERRVLNVLRV